MIAHVLFVCSGNLCRSPMAAGLFACLLPEVAVTSAGLDAPVGHPAAPEAVAVLRSHGIDLSGHRAVRLSDAMCRAADLILVMTVAQRREIEARHPFARGKVFLVREFDRVDVFDPVGESRERFDACYALLATGLADWIAHLGYAGRRRAGGWQ
ncbi:low molecular weight phosphotyrosine protein phosphatase [Burkholderia sp. Ac-20384]|uniref:arsenate reductase/protein-tyrosine-phosphatase family protein n=1 Tax=Burkholderia sp. Ac-20384 TaxID=2703902 RepID=UPI001980B6E8|nr:low molecular weight phosphotyrosine protein phosphatase [Burkholderia sp. Ac-20384]MBN3823269.1 low molecular weight phosphotyrosine protein phosphatase [Burkholderia sp. Ac-20384]